MNILFVEDHPALRYGIAREIRAHGHTVHEAGSAELAMVVLAEHEVDVLITDVGLPGDSGVVLAAEARAERPALHVVIVTGQDIGTADRDRDDGPTVLRKPFTWESLNAAFARLGLG